MRTSVLPLKADLDGPNGIGLLGANNGLMHRSKHHSFDHLVGAQQNGLREREPKSFDCTQIDG